MLIGKLDELQELTIARTGSGSFEYRGFLIRWTGYKPTFDSNKLSGQWLAMSLHRTGEGLYFYTDIGGQGGKYRKGAAFDISGPLSLENSVEEVIAAAVDAKLRLLAMVDEHLGEYRGSPDGRKAE